MPTHPAGYADHHLLRNSLLAIGLAIVAVIVIIAAATTDIGGLTPAEQTTLSETERMNEFRAGERMPLFAPVTTESQRMNEFRAGERMPLFAPVMTESQRMNEFRAGERADWPTLVPEQ